MLHLLRPKHSQAAHTTSAASSDASSILGLTSVYTMFLPWFSFLLLCCSCANDFHGGSGPLPLSPNRLLPILKLDLCSWLQSVIRITLFHFHFHQDYFVSISRRFSRGLHWYSSLGLFCFIRVSCFGPRPIGKSGFPMKAPPAVQQFVYQGNTECLGLKTMKLNNI